MPPRRPKQGEAVVEPHPSDELPQRYPVVPVYRKHERGADDYLSKPFSPRELVARIKAVLRRDRGTPKPDAGALKFDGLIVDEDRRESPHRRITSDARPCDPTADHQHVYRFGREGGECGSL